MTWRQIPFDQWNAFLRGFAREHETWLVEVNPTKGDERTPGAARMEPLRDLRLVETASGRRVIATLGADPSHELAIAEPIRIEVNEMPDGAHGGIAIESERERLVLRFRVAIRAEMVDGLIG